MKKAHFSRDLFSFLEELRSNNRREWFEANRTRYERDVREPMLAFISDFAPGSGRSAQSWLPTHARLAIRCFASTVTCASRRTRAVQKTHVSARFSHTMGHDVHAPGLYVHFEPNGVFAAAGIWHPDPATLAKIRDFIGRLSRGTRIGRGTSRSECRAGRGSRG